MAVYAVKVGGTYSEVDKVALPYEKQMKMLLCERAHICQKAAGKCNKTDKTGNICEQCQEIELALDYLKEKQRGVLGQWQKIGIRAQMKILIPIIDGMEQMTALAKQMGCEAVGEYIEAVMTEQVLDMIEWTE